MSDRLPEDYIAKALQDARRFSGTYDQGTSGTLAAHTHRLIKERRDLLATIDELKRRNADLRAAVEQRLAATPKLPDELAAMHPGATFMPAEPLPPAKFEPTLIRASMPDGQLDAAWAAIANRGRAAREATTPIETRRIDIPQRAGLRIVGICGRAGSGKNTVAGMIPGAAVLQLADPLYAALAAMIGVPEWLLRHRAYKESTIPGIGQSPRQLLQTLGTEWGRALVGEDVWIKVAERKLDTLEAAGIGVAAIADVRFENEAAWVRQRGGQVWHVYRPGGNEDDHASEAGVMRQAGDAVIDNAGTLDDLRRAVESAFAA